MINPTIGQLIENNEDINRYSLVVATAKTARIITDEYVIQREYAEKMAARETDKKNAYYGMVKKEYRDEKAVKNAITGLYEGEFKLVKPNGEEELIGKAAASGDFESYERSESGEDAESK